MNKPENPSLRLLCKLGSIVVHVDEMLSDDEYVFDRFTLQVLLDDAEVQEWIKTMGVYLPQKRRAEP
jgi:hypothetical protein